MLTATKKMLTRALNKSYGVNAFNTPNLEIMEAVLLACQLEKSPVILEFTESDAKYAGLEVLASLVKTLSKEVQIPIALHLDHGKTVEFVKKALAAGFTSVMIDGSSLDYEDNVSLTKKVVDLAHPKGVSVESELGPLGAAEEGDDFYTDPQQALDFVQRTGTDFLAVSIGTSHGAYKKGQGGEIKLDLERLETIHQVVGIPLVLHGASSVPQELVADINQYGGEIKGAKGIPVSEVKEAISRGICKINCRTDLNLAFTAATREKLFQDKQVYDVRKVMTPVKERIVNFIRQRVKDFGSAGQAV